MELVRNEKLTLKRDLDCGNKVLPKGTVFTVEALGINVSLVAEGIGIGMFTRSEIDMYFEKYVEPVEKNINVGEINYSEIKRMVQDYEEGTTFIMLSSGAVGTSKCESDDIFDKEKGIAVAYLKAKISETMEIVNKFKEELREY